MRKDARGMQCNAVLADNHMGNRSGQCESHFHHADPPPTSRSNSLLLCQYIMCGEAIEVHGLPELAAQTVLLHDRLPLPQLSAALEEKADAKWKIPPANMSEK